MKSILLVEDQALIALAEAKTLQDNGYAVEIAYTGRAAVERFVRDETIDLVLVDIGLGPGIDGTEAAREMLARREVPLLFLSSHAEKEIVDRVKGISHYGYILKSAGDFVLIEAIATAFELFEARRSVDERSERLRVLINAAPHIICFKDGGGRWLEANEADLELFGLTDADYRGRTDRELSEETHPLYREAFLTCYESDEAVWSSGRASREIESIDRPDGSTKTFDVIKIPKYHGDGSRKWLIVLGRDITERRNAESEANLRALIEGTDDIIVFRDLEGLVLLYNTPFERFCLRKFGRRALPGLDMRPLLPEPEQRRWDDLLTQIRNGRSVKRQCTCVFLDGDVHELDRAFQAVKRDGKTIGFAEFTRDVTDLHKVEDQLARSLEEKDFLMREMNHRIKNNLAIVSSLVGLKESTSDGAVDLSDIRSQIQSIGIIHDKLSRSDTGADLNVGGYIDDLLRSVFGGGWEGPVDLRIDSEIQTLPAKVLAPVGLLLNEIATNAIKHGFVPRAEARFIVRITSESDETITITVTNSGRRIPDGIQLETGDSLGLALISSLVEQLNGTIVLEREPQTRFTIRFSIPH